MGSSIENKSLNKERLLEIMTDNLPALRAKIGLSQDEVSNIIGISRQTYCAIETHKRKMAWNTFMSLLFVFLQRKNKSVSKRDWCISRRIAGNITPRQSRGYCFGINTKKVKVYGRTLVYSKSTARFDIK